MGNLFGLKKSEAPYSPSNMVPDEVVEEPTPSITSSIDLNTATMKNSKWFSLTGFTVPAKVVKVYDGDTCTCVFDTLGLGLYKHSVRLTGIDTPEIKGKSPEEKERAREVRDFVRERILGKIVQLECKGSDKYGRVLGVITHNGDEINKLLIDNGMALAYDGGKKTAFEFPKAS